MHNKHAFRRLPSQASVAALDFVACQSKKAANIHNRLVELPKAAKPAVP